MVILDPEINGCVVWLIDTPIIKYGNKVTHIKEDTAFGVCKSLINRLTVYKDVKNQFGNYVKRLSWIDDVYLDTSGFGREYKYIFNDFGLDVIDIHSKNADAIIPIMMQYDKTKR